MYLYLYFCGDKPLLFKSPPSPHSRLKLPRLDLVPGSSLCVPDTMSKDGKANMSFSQNLFCKLFHRHIVLEEQNKTIKLSQVGRRWLLTRRWTSFCPQSVWNFESCCCIFFLSRLSQQQCYRGPGSQLQRNILPVGCLQVYLAPLASMLHIKLQIFKKIVSRVSIYAIFKHCQRHSGPEG